MSHHCRIVYNDQASNFVQCISDSCVWYLPSVSCLKMTDYLSLLRVDYKDEKFIVAHHPTLIGFYSVDKERNYRPGISKLQYMNQETNTKVDIDLKIGKNLEWQYKNNIPLYKYLSDHKHILNSFSADDIDDAGFILERSTLLDIFRLLYIPGRRYFAIQLFAGNIYIKSQRFSQNLSDEIARRGHRFEQNLLSNNPQTPPQPLKTIEENEEFSCVFQTQIGRHRILYNSESDGILANEDGNSDPINYTDDEEDVLNQLKNRQFVRLITRIDWEKPKMKKSKIYQSQHIWVKSYFSQANNIIIGWKNKNDQGIITKVTSHTQKDISKANMALNKKTCFKFSDAFFTYVKDLLLKKIVNIDHDSIKELPPIDLILFKGKNDDATVHRLHVIDLSNIPKEVKKFDNSQIIDHKLIIHDSKN